MKPKTFFDEDQPTEKLVFPSTNGNLQNTSIKEENSDDEFNDGGAFTAISSAVKFRGLRKRHLRRNPAIKRFERRYTELGKFNHVNMHLRKFSRLKK